ncbi:MAG: Mpo1-like protein [Gemmata sp.]
MSYRFPIARKLLAFAGRARRSWLDRHQVPANFWLHLLGIPLAFAAVPLLFFVEWYWGTGAVVLGYFIQWVGHRIEGNDVGELIPLKRLLGMPVVAIAPRREERRGQP